jgi:murein DD-endopeptidase MepM/ murein hydrolase activator NlpD
VPASTVDRRVFAPFPVAGLAAWMDTWGAPRYAGGYHPHHGQDLMCTTGTPLLAVQGGVARFRHDPLGGTTILLVRKDGSFWYYAHLSAYAKGLQDGERVTMGERIGACGSTGDATVSHLHFALFTASGRARDPMRPLIRWLHDAEDRAGLRPSDGRGVHVSHRPVDAVRDPAVVSPLRGGPRTLAPGSYETVVPPASDRTTAGATGDGFGLYLGAALLLLPLPLASRRVRAGVRRLQLTNARR